MSTSLDLLEPARFPLIVFLLLLLLFLLLLTTSQVSIGVLLVLLDDLFEGVGLFNLCIDLLLLELLQAVFDVFDGTFGLFEELAATLPVDIETKDLRLIEEDLGREDYGVGVVLEEDVWQGRAEVRAIDVDLPELRKVHLLAARAKNLETGGLKSV